MKAWINGAIIGALFPIVMNFLAFGWALSKIFESPWLILIWALIGALIGWVIGKFNNYKVIIKKSKKKKF
jgi:membrane protein YqaA with SNARE-associated domain